MNGKLTCPIRVSDNPIPVFLLGLIGALQVGFVFAFCINGWQTLVLQTTWR